MPSRIRYNRWPRRITLAITLLLFLGGWWLEGKYLLPPLGQRPSGQLPTGDYRVRRIVDGDTLLLVQDDLRIRLQGIDTPETVKKNTPVQPWGLEATTYTKQFVKTANWLVRLEIEDKALDRYGRHLAFIWHDGRLLNEELVRNGLAHAKTNYDFSDPMKQRLRQAQLDAQAAQRGLWSND